jgi:hypothetical protein
MTAPHIKVYPADLGGCGAYRTIWPGQELERQGANVDVVMPHRDDQVQALWHDGPNGPELVDVTAPDADIVVLQRPLQYTLAEAVPRLQAKGVRVVVEIDDDFEAISPRNVSWSHVDPKAHPERNRDHLRRACAQADMVVVSTPALAARYAPHGRVRIVPNCVPAWYLAVKREDHIGVFVGWSGSTDTHPDDLQVTSGGVARAVRSTGATFAVIGSGRGVRKALGLAVDPPACGWVPLARYPYMVAELDVGVVPLEMSAFNAAKSALKMMEMAALGVVPVVSPTAENLRMTQAGIGVTAENPRQWEGVVKALVGDASRRQHWAQSGRELMRAHTIEANAGRWLDAWSAASLNTNQKACAL